MKRLLAVLSLSILFTACTPVQLDSYEELMGVNIPAALEKELIKLPNKPIDTPRGVVQTDGSVTPVTPQTRVNTAVYIHYDPAPAMTAFRIVAETRGWTSANIQAWSPFASAVMYRESRYCPNVRRGAVIRQAYGCVLAKQGPHSDSGFAQLISIHHGPGQWLCVQEGICGAEGVVATPWNSMTAFVALLERSGSQPWCYTASLRAGSTCRLAP